MILRCFFMVDEKDMSFLLKGQPENGIADGVIL